MIRPLEPIYQRSGSMSMAYIPSTRATEERKGRKGGILVSFAKASGPKAYDAENAIKMSLPLWDAMQILEIREKGFPKGSDGKEQLKFFHQYNNVTKTLGIFPGKDDTTGWGMRSGEESILIYCQPHNMAGIYKYVEKCVDAMMTEEGNNT